MTEARFVTGSTMRHVVIMTFTGALGLMALFLVDLADLFFLSLLNQTEITAAVGYAGTIVFANLSISIGSGIAAAALVARNLGAGQPDRARDFATSSLMFSLLISAATTVIIAVASHWLLDLLGAKGEAKHLALLFIWTLTPGYVLLAGAVCCSFILRGLGDPKRAMYITLAAAIVTALVDPLFIFGFGWASREPPPPMCWPMWWPSASASMAWPGCTSFWRRSACQAFAAISPRSSPSPHPRSSRSWQRLSPMPM